MNILIVGANGQLGRDCQTALPPAHEIFCLDLPELDIADAAQVSAWVQRIQPDCLVNCAAYTRVDDAESHADLCRAVNAEGPRNLAAACRQHRIPMIHISTDYVFDGALPPGGAYTEDSPTNPLGVYGRTKLEGEAPVLALEQGAVLRTAWLYGAQGANFLRTMLRLALRQPPQPIRVVNDQTGSPTWSGRLARQIARLLEDFRPGLYHATAHGSCTWYQLAQRFLARLQVPHELVPIATPEYPTPARRPANSVLENRNLQKAGLDVMIPWEADVDAFADAVRTAWMRELGGAG
ncbi:MAG: dTDP-4-dehydrorhamnose reductase [Kiritimatiellae bacterium]|nr:dTDP-4-dehydrorhamnose reductase [Kiritimatiellia bacterium]